MLLRRQRLTGLCTKKPITKARKDENTKEEKPNQSLLLLSSFSCFRPFVLS
jgi:hypothetical protein